jgi:MFS family permease
MELLVSETVVQPAREVTLPITGRLARLYLLESLGSVCGSLLTLGVFFYMHTRFDFHARQNFFLSAAQGLTYVFGALASNPLSHAVGRRKYLRSVNLLMAGIALLVAFAPRVELVVGLLVFYTAVMASQWPVMESLVSSGADAKALSRRISLYNLVWSATGAVTVAACGSIIAVYPKGIFFLASAAHVAMSMILLKREVDPESGHGQAEPEPELVKVRTLAMRLSRVALPATYAVTNSVGALMPSLAVIRALSPQLQTLAASVWMAARWVTFMVLGASSWWHTRPRAMLVAAIVLLAAFLGVTLIPSLAVMMVWQVALGAAMAMIYSASLYFGMVLSDGSTHQGGYHEALIGLGCILGPGAGAMAEVVRPGETWISVYSIAGVIWVSVMIASVVSIQKHRTIDQS